MCARIAQIWIFNAEHIPPPFSPGITATQDIEKEVKHCVEQLHPGLDLKSLHRLRMELSYKPVEYVPAAVRVCARR